MIDIKASNHLYLGQQSVLPEFYEQQPQNDKKMIMKIKNGPDSLLSFCRPNCLF